MPTTPAARLGDHGARLAVAVPAAIIDGAFD
jgi:hypothetical protein